MSDPSQSAKARPSHVVVDSLATEAQDPSEAVPAGEEPLVRVGHMGAPEDPGGLPDVDDDVMVVGVVTIPPRRDPSGGRQGPDGARAAGGGARRDPADAAGRQIAAGSSEANGDSDGDADDDDPLGLKDRRPVAQVVVIAIMVVLLVLAALYILDYWGVAPTGFSGIVDGIGTRMS